MREVPPSPATPPSPELCRRLLAQDKPEPASQCFAQLGQGTGLGADMALYEAARLNSERLREPRRALALLEEHERRFPTSALRGEVELLRIESLRRAGQLEQALAASEQLLARPIGRAAAAQLHELRGKIYEQRHDYQLAASEYVAFVGEPSAQADAAELRRAECLEKLGQLEAASAAYTRYLRREAPRDAARARARLAALTPGTMKASGEEP